MVAGVGRLKQRSTEFALGEILKLLSSNPEKNLVRMARLAETLGTSEYQRHNAKVWREYFETALEQDPPPVAMQLGPPRYPQHLLALPLPNRLEPAGQFPVAGRSQTERLGAGQ